MNRTPWQVMLMMHKKLDKQNKGQSEKGKQKHPPVLHSHPHTPSLKHPVSSFGMPVSKMDILRQSLQKQNLNTIQTTPSTIPSTTPLTIPSDSLERPKVQTPAWVVESKAIGEKTVRKFNSTTIQTELEGKVSYNSFDSNIELIDGFQNLKNREFEFTNKEKYISVKGKLKQNQSFWKNTISLQ